jgi:hypothetical protein
MVVGLVWIGDPMASRFVKFSGFYLPFLAVNRFDTRVEKRQYASTRAS